MKVTFKQVTNNKIKHSFLDALKEFIELHDYSIVLHQKQVKKSTMQAQPIINLKNSYNGVRKYRIQLGIFVSSSQTLRVEDVPLNVLRGWFAHELGHLVDYLSYSNFGMIKYGLKYVFSNAFKRRAEHEADYIAIKKGFKEDIIATKRWLFSHKLIDQEYKDKLKKFYLSIEQVELCDLNTLPFKPKVE